MLRRTGPRPASRRPVLSCRAMRGGRILLTLACTTALGAVGGVTVAAAGTPPQALPPASPPDAQVLSDEQHRDALGLSGAARARLLAAVRQRAQGRPPAPAHRGQVPRAVRRARALDRPAGQPVGPHPPAQAPERREGLGPGRRPRSPHRQPQVDRCEQAHAAPARLRPRQGRHDRARRRRQEGHDHAVGPLLRAREVPREGRAALRAARDRHERLRPDAHRLAGRRRRRPARHEPAGAHPRPARRTAASA